MFDFLNKIREALSGFKTYIVLAAAAFAVAVEVGLGWDIPHFDPGPNWVDYLWIILAGTTMRAAISKPATPPVTVPPAL